MIMEGAKQEFSEFLQAQLAKPSNSLFSKTRVELIRRYLLGESHNDIPIRLRQFVKEKKFELRNFSEYGLENVLVVPRHKNNQKQQEKNGLFDGFRRVICSDDIFEVVKSVHEKSSCHSGVQKTFEFVSSNYEGIPRLCVQEYCKLCPICSCKKPQLTRALLKPN